MSFLSKLVLGSTEYTVLAADYEVSQTVDAQGRPNGKPKAGMIRLTLESSGNNDIIQWAADDKMTKEGKLVFYRRDTNSPMKTIGFKDAHCYYMQEVFDAKSTEPMKMNIHISAGSLDLNGSAQVAHPWSSIANLVTDVANTLGLGGMLGAAGAMADGAMNSPEMKQAEEMATNAYNTGAQAASTAQRVEKEAEEAKDQSEAAASQAEQQVKGAEKQVDDAKHEVDDAGKDIGKAEHEVDDAKNSIPSFKPF